ncbi:hypothetical protein HPP92_013921 [Vanilla planifolia]|uniref:phosphopyruvate hydratase n=1 Tax=Vanilla planifolia TaxID=51239 RepID=A0A835R4F0_VANPL|nr:hypothetical protein HPP92_013921 [Vanilla planifolia]
MQAIFRKGHTVIFGHHKSIFNPISSNNSVFDQLQHLTEIMIVPVGANSFEEAMQMGSETYHHLKSVIIEKYGSGGCNVGDDGGFAPNVSSVFEGLDLTKEAVHRAGYSGRIKFAIDVGATEFCIGKKYDLDFKSPHKSGQNFKTGEDMIEMYSKLCAEYPIISIEQPFDKDDWGAHTATY